MEIIDLCNNGDEPTGFLVMGHHPIDEVRSILLKRQLDEWGIDEEEVDPLEEIHHEWIVQAPSASHDGEGTIVTVEEGWLGAIAVTHAYCDWHKPWTTQKELDRQRRERDKIYELQQDYHFAASHLVRAISLIRDISGAASKGSWWAVMASIFISEVEPDKPLYPEETADRITP